LRFVNDQHGRLAHPVMSEQPLLKCLEPPQSIVGVVLEPKITQHIIKKLRSAHAGIENKCGRCGFFAQLLDQLPKEQGLPGTHFANQKNQALASLYAIKQTSVGLVGLGSAEKKVRVGSDIERIFDKPEKVLVHSEPTILISSL
jgi:hypothetical protein